MRHSTIYNQETREPTKEKNFRTLKVRSGKASFLISSLKKILVDKHHRLSLPFNCDMAWRVLLLTATNRGYKRIYEGEVVSIQTFLVTEKSPTKMHNAMPRFKEEMVLQ